jgi:2-oxoglutarate ferredoxin oxidoreductase subunit beta
VFTEKSSKPEEALFVEQGKPLIFGASQNKGIRLSGLKPEVVELGTDYSADDLWIHDEKDIYKAQVLSRMFDHPTMENHFPRPFGVLYAIDRPCYEQQLYEQVEQTLAAKGKGDLDTILAGKETWTVL